MASLNTYTIFGLSYPAGKKKSPNLDPKDWNGEQLPVPEQLGALALELTYCSARNLYLHHLK